MQEFEECDVRGVEQVDLAVRALVDLRQVGRGAPEPAAHLPAALGQDAVVEGEVGTVGAAEGVARVVAVVSQVGQFHPVLNPELLTCPQGQEGPDLQVSALARMVSVEISTGWKMCVSTHYSFLTVGTYHMVILHLCLEGDLPHHLFDELLWQHQGVAETIEKV